LPKELIGVPDVAPDQHIEQRRFGNISHLAERTSSNAWVWEQPIWLGEFLRKAAAA
jgi:hypothetical protein